MNIISLSTLIRFDKQILSYRFGYSKFIHRYTDRSQPKNNLDLLLHRIKRKK